MHLLKSLHNLKDWNDFASSQSNFNKKPDRHAIGIDYQIKNKLLIGTSVSYNTITNNVNMNFKVGFKIF